MNWTDERVEQLKKLWAEGLSASQIAAQLGGVSRNAVIGKVHRLKLSGRGKTTSTQTRSKKVNTNASGGSAMAALPVICRAALLAAASAQLLCRPNTARIWSPTLS